MKLSIEIPDSMITVEQAKLLDGMKSAILVVEHADGTGAFVYLDPIPSRITPMDLLNLKMRMVGK